MTTRMGRYSDRDTSFRPHRRRGRDVRPRGRAGPRSAGVAAFRATRTGASSNGALSLGAAALGAMALGAVAMGAASIGALAIGRLVIRRAVARELRLYAVRIDRLDIDELSVRTRVTLPSEPPEQASRPVD